MLQAAFLKTNRNSDKLFFGSKSIEIFYGIKKKHHTFLISSQIFRLFKSLKNDGG